MYSYCTNVRFTISIKTYNVMYNIISTSYMYTQEHYEAVCLCMKIIGVVNVINIGLRKKNTITHY